MKIDVASDGKCKVSVESPMTIYEAVEQRKEFIEILEQQGDLEIDLSEVGEMDTAGIQILLLVKRSAGERNKVVNLISHSPACLEVIERYNLAEHFGDQVVLPSGD